MECTRARKILSEYIDGALDRQTAELLEVHLAECKDCGKEHSSLRALINEIGLMDPVEAPKDFLEKINERIDATSRFKGITRFILFPARVKIPLELTALAVTSVLIFLVFNMVQPDNNAIYAPSGTDETDVALIPGPESRGETNKSLSRTKPENWNTPLKFALLLEPREEEQPLSTENVLLTTRGRDTSINPELSFAPSPSKQDLTLLDIISDMNEIITLIEGRLLSEGHEEGIDNVQYMNVEIPAANYQAFLDKVEKVATLRESAPELPEGYRDKILLNIKIKSSN